MEPAAIEAPEAVRRHCKCCLDTQHNRQSPKIRDKPTCTASPPLQALQVTPIHSLALLHTHAQVFLHQHNADTKSQHTQQPRQAFIPLNEDTLIIKARCNSHQQTVQVGNGVRGERLDPKHREHDTKPHCRREAVVRSGSGKAPAMPPHPRQH